jgi:hypothetical protein
MFEYKYSAAKSNKSSVNDDRSVSPLKVSELQSKFGKSSNSNNKAFMADKSER